MKKGCSILEWSFYLFQLSKRKASGVASRTGKWPARKQEILMLAPDRRMPSLLFFIELPIYIMWVRIFDEPLYQVSAIAREKTSEMSRWGAGKCPHFRTSGSP